MSAVKTGPGGTAWCADLWTVGGQDVPAEAAPAASSITRTQAFENICQKPEQKHPQNPAEGADGHTRTEQVGLVLRGVSKSRRLQRGLVKKGRDGEEEKNEREGGEDEFIHQVSLRAQSVLRHGWSQSRASLRLSRGARSARSWAPPAGPPSPPGPASPGCGC